MMKRPRIRDHWQSVVFEESEAGLKILRVANIDQSLSEKFQNGDHVLVTVTLLKRPKRQPDRARKPKK